YSGDICILAGFGNGTFVLVNRFIAGVHPVAMVAGDFNHDDHIDLAVNDVFLGWVTTFNGQGNFGFDQPGPNQVVFLNGALGSLVTGDFNGDKILDLVAADRDHNRVAVLRGRGNGTFEDPLLVPVGQAPRALVVSDFNADGISDLAVANL